jgi:uncharacterized protein YjbI with pentapeptide repeats
MKPAKLQLEDLDTTDYKSFADLVAADERLTDVNVTSDQGSSLNATGARFDNVYLSGDFMNGAYLPKLQALDVIWDSCSLVAANFEEASIERCELTNCRADGILYVEAELQKVRFTSCRLVLGNFRSAVIKNVVFEDCDLSEADFYGATLENVWFENCSLQQVNFTNVKGKNIDLRSSECRDISGIASLSGAVISSQQLIELAPEFAAALKIRVADDD